MKYLRIGKWALQALACVGWLGACVRHNVASEIMIIGVLFGIGMAMLSEARWHLRDEVQRPRLCRHLISIENLLRGEACGLAHYKSPAEQKAYATTILGHAETLGRVRKVVCLGEELPEGGLHFESD